jgi:hypothetical protein
MAPKAKAKGCRAGTFIIFIVGVSFEVGPMVAARRSWMTPRARA